MDVTNVFKACVKTARTRNRGLGLSSNNDDTKQAASSSSSDILKKRTSKSRNEFANKAKEIVGDISKLNAFLLEHRKAYMSNADHLSLDASEMNDNDRDQIDLNAQVVMRSCARMLREFKEEVSKQQVMAQQREHRDGVFHMIDRYLKEVCNTYGEQRAIRVKRAIDKQRLFRLEPEAKKRKSAIDRIGLPSTSNAIVTPSNDKTSAALPAPVVAETLSPFSEGADGPSPDEIQMFELENERMYNELSTLGDEVRHIEGQVVEISKLQEVFTSKILQQEHDLERVADTVVGTTENIKDANEEIREAMKKNASFRVWILFFLIVMAFSLLFLDWYNP